MLSETRDKRAAARTGLPGFGRWNAIRRFMSGRWRRFHGTSVLIALPGLAFQFVDVGYPATGQGKLWHDAGLLFLLGAVTVPLWRRIERDFTGLPRWREALRKPARRTSVVLVAGAICGLVAYRWLVLRAEPSAATTVAHLAGLSLVLALVAPALELVVWSFLPPGVKRPDPAIRSAGAASQAMPNTMKVVQEYPGGRPQELRAGDQTKQFASLTMLITWDGRSLVATDARRKRVRAFPVRPLPALNGDVNKQVSAQRDSQIVEIVHMRIRGCQSRGSVMCLDDTGQCLIVVDPCGFAPQEVKKLAILSGLPFRSYSADAVLSGYPKLRERMFPRSPRCWRIRP